MELVYNSKMGCYVMQKVGPMQCNMQIDFMKSCPIPNDVARRNSIGNRLLAHQICRMYVRVVANRILFLLQSKEIPERQNPRLYH